MYLHLYFSLLRNPPGLSCFQFACDQSDTDHPAGCYLHLKVWDKVGELLAQK